MTGGDLDVLMEGIQAEALRVCPSKDGTLVLSGRDRRRRRAPSWRPDGGCRTATQKLCRQKAEGFAGERSPPDLACDCPPLTDGLDMMRQERERAGTCAPPAPSPPGPPVYIGPALDCCCHVLLR